MDQHKISSLYCDKDDKKCLSVAERFKRTNKLMIEKYLTINSANRSIDNLRDFVHNYNSLFHFAVSIIPDRLEMLDEVKLMRKSIPRNNQIKNPAVKRGDIVRLLKKQVAFESEDHGFTSKIYIVEDDGLNSVRVKGKQQKFNVFEMLKASPFIQNKYNFLRRMQFDIYRAHKRARKRGGIEPKIMPSKRSRKLRFYFIVTTHYLLSESFDRLWNKRILKPIHRKQQTIH